MGASALSVLRATGRRQGLPDQAGPCGARAPSRTSAGAAGPRVGRWPGMPLATQWRGPGGRGRLFVRKDAVVIIAIVATVPGGATPVAAFHLQTPPIVRAHLVRRQYPSAGRRAAARTGGRPAAPRPRRLLRAAADVPLRAGHGLR